MLDMVSCCRNVSDRHFKLDRVEMDMQCIKHCEPDSPYPPVEYSQPVWQTLQMFVGEAFCLVLYALGAIYQYYFNVEEIVEDDEDEALLENQAPASYGSTEATPPRGRQPHRKLVRRSSSVWVPQPRPPANESTFSIMSLANPPPFVSFSLRFFFPAMCDIFATTLMNVALLMMPVSFHVMTRGALVLWVGLFSVMFLSHHLHLYQWLSLVMVMGGVVLVGLSSIIVQHETAMSQLILTFLDASKESAVKTLTGVALVLVAQIFSAMQFVWEEKIMREHRLEPLVVVGLEGLFGMIQILVGMLVLHRYVGSKPSGQGGFFDLRAGFEQTLLIAPVRISAFMCAASIAMYNSFGLNVTRAVSATARSTIDTFRTLGICAVSVWLGWEVLRPLSGSVQALGFAMLAYGTFLFNGVVSPPRWMQRSRGYQGAA
ncbi:Uncharacterized protein MSYG_4355 [Malassezia sympodialis ATCC 42132]|uniref:Uncharacterized protein n=2 Tax=Malassezia sympodialis (strain ATCC 42132) TaxID=1230383 RepID=A0A1M8AC49_MALS4|nr:Uncharacterized protein MSYG_4355 [Malassezia sympodialis ATCC 42132]